MNFASNFLVLEKEKIRLEEIARYWERKRTRKNTLCCSLKLPKRHSPTFMAPGGCILLHHQLARAKSVYINFLVESAEKFRSLELTVNNGPYGRMEEITRAAKAS